MDTKTDDIVFRVGNKYISFNMEYMMITAVSYLLNATSICVGDLTGQIDLCIIK